MSEVGDNYTWKIVFYSFRISWDFKLFLENQLHPWSSMDGMGMLFKCSFLLWFVQSFNSSNYWEEAAHREPWECLMGIQTCRWRQVSLGSCLKPVNERRFCQISWQSEFRQTVHFNWFSTFFSVYLEQSEGRWNVLLCSCKFNFSLFRNYIKILVAVGRFWS